MVRFRKTISLLLVLCLVMAMLPTEALAASAHGPEATPLAEEESSTITLDGESMGTQPPTEAGSSTDGQKAENGETLPPVDDVESGRDGPSGVPEDDVSASVDALDMISSKGNDDEETVTRIAWIHELASRFSASPEDYGFAEVAFSDYSQSEEYYQDAVWAWNMGLFPENDDLSIDPFAPATYEFSANTLCSCLDLGLSAESTAYAVMASVEDSGTDSMQVAERRGWFDGDTGSLMQT